MSTQASQGQGGTAKRKKNLDMTQGNPSVMLVKFAIPMLLGNLFQQMYNMVDSIVVGRFVSTEALAAVGTSMPVFFLIVSLFMGFGVGASILISQFYGAREYDAMRRTANTTLTLTLFAGVILSVIGYIGAPYILKLMQVDSDYYDMALSYMRVIMMGTVVTLYYNIISGILRGLGDARSPLYFLIISSIINTVLDLVFVIVFKMGVEGVAYATIIAQTASVIFAAFRLGKVDENLKIKLKDMRVDWKLAKSVVQLGLPSGLQQSVFSIAMMINQGMINSFGYVITACFNAVMRVDMFVMMPMMSVGMAITTFVGQNIGANNMDRVKQGSKSAVTLCVGVGIVLSTGLFFFGKYMLALFTDDLNVIEPGIKMMQTLAFFYPIAGLGAVIPGILRGAGEAKMPMINSVITALAIRLPAGYILMKLMNSHEGLYWGMVVGWLAGCTQIVIYYFMGKWRERCIVRMQERLNENKRQPQEESPAADAPA